jgi:transcriptional regulator with XRE-family HTH domain
VLAQRLGLKKQQVQRYEATRYAGVSLERVQQVADALGVKIREQVFSPVARPAPPPAQASGKDRAVGTRGLQRAGRPTPPERPEE